MVGRNLKFEVGTVIYKGDSAPLTESSNIGVILGSTISILVALIVAVILILVVSLIFIKRRFMTKQSLLATHLSHVEMVETKRGDFPCLWLIL